MVKCRERKDLTSFRITSFNEVASAFAPNSDYGDGFKNETIRRKTEVNTDEKGLAIPSQALQSYTRRSTYDQEPQIPKYVTPNSFALHYPANGSASNACCALNSKYRWALSGTPLQNSVNGELNWKPFSSLCIAHINIIRAIFLPEVPSMRVGQRCRIVFEKIFESQ